MNSEVCILFGELSGLPLEERERYYAAHSTPEETRREVESLLSFGTGPIIEHIVQAAFGAAFQEPLSDGDSCGPFRLLSIIGRGGMGVVYLAERVDGEVRQQVAVKLLRGGFDSTGARQRFLQERQILAHLAHPNIARLIDAGHRSDGYPYLVMEYVDGRPIDEHCRTLPVREKVVLVAALCDAIASAHQSLVVHRDLKPSNILVDRNGNPRVLDFGIAKILDASDSTHTIDRRMTPEYASPEQFTGQPVTTATDIYSLGAVLYKLLSGEPPARSQPLSPGRIGAGIDRDLDAIVMKAIRAEPLERYFTADKLAEDLRAWLDRQPVSARQGERWYHTRRQLRRYWVPLAAGAFAVSGLSLGLVLARTQRNVAQQRFEVARRLANEFLSLDKDIQNLPGSATVRQRIVSTSIQYLEALSKRAGDDWRLKADIAAGYRKAAEAQGIFRGVNLGRPEEARHNLDKAAALLAEVSVSASGDRQVLRDLVDLTELQMRMETSSKNLKTLEAKIHELQDLLARYEPEATSPDDLRFLGKVYESMTFSAKELRGISAPMTFARRAVEFRRKSVEHDHSFDARGGLANALAAYASLLRATGDLSAAVEIFEESLAVMDRMAAENPNHYKVQVNTANTHASLARALGEANGPSLRQTDAAVRHFEESLRIGRRLMVLDPNENQIRYNHAMAAWRLGNALAGRDPRSALERYDEAAVLLRPMALNRPGRDAGLVAALSDSTFVLRAVGRSSEVPQRMEEAGAICEPYRIRNVEVYTDCSESTSRAAAGVALAQRRPLDAVAAHREWLRIAEQDNTLEQAKEDIYNAFVVVDRYRLLRDALRAAGRQAEADQVDQNRQSIVKFWKTRLSGRNDAETILTP